MATLDAQLDKTGVREAYRRLAPRYDLWSTLAESRARRRCLELAQIRNGESVLEVAVGTGALFVEILRANPDGRNVGIDLTEEMLAIAKDRAQQSGAFGYQLSMGDAYDLQFADGSFDVLLNSYMFDLIPEKDFLHILRQFKRVLRPGGRMVLVNMTKGSRWFEALWKWIYERRASLLGGCRGVELSPYMQKAGFRDVHREFVRQLMFPSEVIFAVRK